MQLSMIINGTMGEVGSLVKFVAVNYAYNTSQF